MSRTLKDIAEADLGWVLALNGAAETETSSLDTAKLCAMLQQAWRARSIGQDAFLIAFDQDACYESVNFRWFGARHARFIYIDRVICAPHTRRQGLARALYDDLARAAREAGHNMLCCEVNERPANPASIAFHHRLGFVPVGLAALPSGKSVRYYERRL